MRPKAANSSVIPSCCAFSAAPPGGKLPAGAPRPGGIGTGRTECPIAANSGVIGQSLGDFGRAPGRQIASTGSVPKKMPLRRPQRRDHEGCNEWTQISMHTRMDCTHFRKIGDPPAPCPDSRRPVSLLLMTVYRIAEKKAIPLQKLSTVWRRIENRMSQNCNLCEDR